MLVPFNIHSDEYYKKIKIKKMKSSVSEDTEKSKFTIEGM
jgi:hypothetical protein